MLSQAQRTTILELSTKGVSKREIARVLGISRVAVRKVLRSNSIALPELQRPEKAEPYRQQILELFDHESGQRSGAWMKMRVNRSQEFIIGGYSVGGSTFDAVIVGEVVDGKLVYVARTRSGFTPALRAELLRKMKPLEVGECPFCNLPESRAGRWGEGLTADKMKECRWLRPDLTGRFEFLEWTEDGHLRHSGFVGFLEAGRTRDQRNHQRSSQ